MFYKVNFNYLLLVVSLLLLLNTKITQAQNAIMKLEKDSTELSPKKTNFMRRMFAKGFAVLPVAFYSPETRFGAGLTGFYYFRLKKDSITRPSSINLVAIYTQNKQLIFQAPFQVAFNKNKSILEGELGVFRYPFRFYGVGNEIDNKEFEFYESDILRVKTIFYKKVGAKTFIGPRLRYEQQQMRSFEAGKKLETQNFLGKEGGRILGLGGSLLIDRRNNIFTPTKGEYLNLTTYASVSSFVSDYNLTESVLDVRKYFPVGKTSIATQLYLQYQTGDVPFFMLAEMGGNMRMRGFFQGIYQDKVFTTVQTEWRFPLFWRLGAVAFGSVGQVNDNLEIHSDYIRFSGGAGIRFLFNEKENINLRIDYARGKNTSGFYLTVGEAF
jgi:hypothetical protein